MGQGVDPVLSSSRLSEERESSLDARALGACQKYGIVYAGYIASCCLPYSQIG
jgi:hypothetical protein